MFSAAPRNVTADSQASGLAIETFNWSASLAPGRVTASSVCVLTPHDARLPFQLHTVSAFDGRCIGSPPHADGRSCHAHSSAFKSSSGVRSCTRMSSVDGMTNGSSDSLRRKTSTRAPRLKSVSRLYRISLDCTCGTTWTPWTERPSACAVAASSPRTPNIPKARFSWLSECDRVWELYLMLTSDCDRPWSPAPDWLPSLWF